MLTHVITIPCKVASISSPNSQIRKLRHRRGKVIGNTQPTSSGAAGVQTVCVGGEEASRFTLCLPLWDLVWALAKDGGYHGVLGLLGFQELLRLAEMLTKSSLAQSLPEALGG